MDAAWLSIGNFAAVSGLTPRALRLYDEAGVLVPVAVDPMTGYRSYASSQIERAELIRLLRAGGVAIGDLNQVLDGEVEAAATLLDRHVAGLTKRAEQQRAAIHLVRTRLTTSTPGDRMSRTTLSRTALTTAVLAAGRCCAADVEPTPSLTGIRLRADVDGLHLASSDRYSAAFVDLSCEWDHPIAVDRLVPAGFLVGASPRWPAKVTVDLNETGLTVAGESVPTIEEPYPDIDSFRAYLDGLTTGCTVDTVSLLDALPETDGPTDSEPAVVLRVDKDDLVVSVRGRDSKVEDTQELARIPATVRGPMDTAWVSPSRLRAILELSGAATVLSLASETPLAIAPEGEPNRSFLLMPMAPLEVEQRLTRTT